MSPKHLSLRFLAVLTIATLSTAVAACSTRPRTQVTVEVHAQPGVRAQLTRLHVRAQGFDTSGLVAGMTFDRDVDAPIDFPVSLAIVPQGEDTTRTFRFEAVGYAGSEQIAVVRARSGFRPGQTLRLVLVLEDACLGVTCTTLETCEAGACVDAAVDPTTLAPLDSDAAVDAASLDAGRSMDDAFVSPTDDAFVSPMDDAFVGPDAAMDPDAHWDAGPCGLDTTLTYCPGESACFDLQNDDAHCGSCDVFCVGGRSCRAGACIFASTGAEGAFRPATSTMLAPGVHHFTVINIPAGVVITTSGTGTLDLRATGTITVNGTIDVSGGDGADGINPSATYGGSGGGGGTGNPTPATSRGDGCGAAGTGGEGAAGANGTSGGSGGCTPPGGMFGAGVGGTWGGGGSGGGGFAGGGGGGGGTGRGGNGGAAGGEVGGAGGDVQIVSVGGAGYPHGTGGRGGRASGVYAGLDGVEAASCHESNGWWTGGGGGGSIGDGAAADPSVTSTFQPGSAGGGGGSNAQNGGGSDGGGGGGGAGGAVRLSSPMGITVGATGRLLADGGDGGDAGESSGAGGGGSGGVVYLAAPTMTIEGQVVARAGSGGANAMCGANGGAGGVGRVRVSVDPSMCTIGGSATVDPPLHGGACAAAAPVAGEAFVGAWPD